MTIVFCDEDDCKNCSEDVTVHELHYKQFDELRDALGLRSKYHDICQECIDEINVEYDPPLIIKTDDIWQIALNKDAKRIEDEH